MKVFFAALTLLSFGLYGQNPDLQIGWERNYPFIDDAVFSMSNFLVNDFSNTVRDDKGNLYHVSNITSPPQNYKKYRLSKFSESGIWLWSIDQADTAYPNIEAGAIAVDSTGNIHIAAYAYSYFHYQGRADLIYTKFNPEGELLWKKRFSSDLPYHYTFIIPKAIQFDNNENAIIDGVVGQFNSLDDEFFADSILLLKYNPAGDLLWAAETMPDTIYLLDYKGVALDDSGNVYVGCHHYWYTPNRSHYAYMVVKYDNNGNYEWHATYTYTGEYCRPTDLTIDSKGNLYITGYASYPYNNTRNYIWLTVSFDRNGHWRKTLINEIEYGDYFETGGLVSSDSEDNIYIAGRRYYMGEYYFALDKYDSTGAFVWEKRFDLNFYSVFKLHVMPDNSLVIASLDDTYDLHVLSLDKDGEKQWEKVYGDYPQYYYAPVNLTDDRESNLLITVKPYNNPDIYLDLFDKSGDTSWRVSMKDYGMHQLKKIITEVQGNVYAVGIIDNGMDDYDFATLKYSASGIALWGNRYQGPAGMQDIPEEITLDNSGNVYVTGSSEGIGTANDYVVIKYDSLGDEKWNVRYNGPALSADEAKKVSIDDAMNVYVTGNSLNSDGNYDIATVKYNAAGQFQWVRRYNGASNGYDTVCGLELDAEGNIYVGGTSDSIGTLYNYILIKYNPSGDVQWTRRYNGPGNDGDQAQAMAMDNSGNLYLTGWSVGYTTLLDYTTIKYSSEGELLWVARWDDPSSQSEEAYGIAVDASENVYITGYSPGAGTGNDFTTVKYDNLGQQQWASNYNGEDNSDDVALQIATDHNGDIYVAGSINSTNELALVKYNNMGIELWDETYRYGDYQNSPVALVLDTTGNIYLGGNSYNEVTGFWSIIKYNQPGFLSPTGEEPVSGVPEMPLSYNYPNPFNSSTTIWYSVPTPNHVSLKVYTLFGNEITTLVNEKKTPGIHEVKFDAGALKSGVFIYQLRTGNFIVSRVIQLIK